MGVRPFCFSATQVPWAAFLRLVCPFLSSPFVVCTPSPPLSSAQAPLCLSRFRRLLYSSSPAWLAFLVLSMASCEPAPGKGGRAGDRRDEPLSSWQSPPWSAVLADLRSARDTSMNCDARDFLQRELPTSKNVTRPPSELKRRLSAAVGLSKDGTTSLTLSSICICAHASPLSLALNMLITLYRAGQTNKS